MWIRQSWWLWWALSGTLLLPYCEDLYPHCLLMLTRLMINTWHAQSQTHQCHSHTHNSSKLASPPTSHLFPFFCYPLLLCTAHTEERRQPNNHIHLDQLLKTISWRPTIIIFWDDLLLTIFFLVLITKCHLNNYRKYNEKFFPLGYTILLVKYEQLLYL